MLIVLLSKIEPGEVKMSQKTVIQIKSNIKHIVNELIFQLRNFYPHIQINDSKKKEFIERFNELIDYWDCVDRRRKEGETISHEEIYSKVFEILGVNYSEEDIKKMIDSMRLSKLIDFDSEEAYLKEYIVFMNNLVEVSFANNNIKDLEEIIYNIEIPQIVSSYQFMCLKADDINSFLFKKPFRFTSRSIPKLTDIYEDLCGYYETFVILIISAYELVYENKPFIKSSFTKLAERKFGEVLKFTEKIPDFEVFRKPYDKTLRNKLVHKDFKIDYNNKTIDFSNRKISFRELLIMTRNLFDAVTSIMYIYNFIVRKKLQVSYYLFKGDIKT